MGSSIYGYGTVFYCPDGHDGYVYSVKQEKRVKDFVKQKTSKEIIEIQRIPEKSQTTINIERKISSLNLPKKSSSPFDVQTIGKQTYKEKKITKIVETEVDVEINRVDFLCSGNPLMARLQPLTIKHLYFNEKNKPPEQINKQILFVNGIGNSINNHISSLIEIARVTGANVLGLYNKSEGIAKDLWQCLCDKLEIQDLVSNNLATATLAGLIKRAVETHNNPINIVAHSQGALIATNAIWHVAINMVVEEIMKETGLTKENILRVEGFNEPKKLWEIRDARKKMVENFSKIIQSKGLTSNITLQTYGGATQQYPPQGIKFTPVTDVNEILVANPLGLGNDPNTKHTEKGVKLPFIFGTVPFAKLIGALTVNKIQHDDFIAHNFNKVYVEGMKNNIGNLL